jgi:hypothetical protein
MFWKKLTSQTNKGGGGGKMIEAAVKHQNGETHKAFCVRVLVCILHPPLLHRLLLAADGFELLFFNLNMRGGGMKEGTRGSFLH